MTLEPNTELENGKDHELIEGEDPIVNCHAHIFTVSHVPPWLARTYLWWPFYYILHFPFIVLTLRKLKVLLREVRHSWLSRTLQKIVLGMRYFFYSLGFVFTLFSMWLTIQVFFFLYDLARKIIQPDNEEGIGWIESLRDFLDDYYLLIDSSLWLVQVLLLMFLLVFVKWGRNLIIFIFKKLWKFLGMLPGKQTTELLQRYMNIGWYASYKDQHTAFSRLRGQYPPATRFVALPMDMEFMKAGRVKESYHQQMKDLKKIKENHKDLIYPFVFVDPRRIVKEGASFFNFSQKADGTIELGKDCFIQEYIEQSGFAGFKIYPALGYYPFDEALLPLWLYASQKQIPIMTHCIRGTIFYRGWKKSDWNRHPVFEQSIPGGGGYEPLLLPELANVDFSVNFTHPLNYLCLLDERLLRIVVEKSSPEVQKVFGYKDSQTRLEYDLSTLKICFGHYGGDDEWEHYLEQDRDNLSARIVRHPLRGIEFLNDLQPDPQTGLYPPITKQGKPEMLWKETDWYSIVTSMMLQYENIYGDISYIIHSEKIFPLLKSSLHKKHGQLRERILFGTDFYVVRNHKSERRMLADTMGSLSKEEFDLIARENPKTFL